MAIVKAVAIYAGGTHELVRDSQTGLYTADASALKRELKTDQRVSYYPVMLRVTDDAGNTTVKTISDAMVGDNLLLTVRETDLFPMQFIVADARGEELAFVDMGNNVDLDLGDSNDFLIDLPATEETQRLYGFGHLIYIPGTEYGGILEDRKTSTKQGTISYMGHTWRGLLSRKIVEPPAGQTHLTVTGDANKILKDIVGARFGSIFVVDDISSGITINYQFDRYTAMLDGLTKMLATKDARLKIYYKQGYGLESGAVHLCAVPIADWSEELEYSQDNRVNFSTRDYRMGINHLICAGEGEGIDRAILHLYVDGSGNIGDTQYYKGLSERTAVYSYTSADDVDKLREDGIKRLKELLNYTEFEITLDNMDVELGDIIGGRDRLTGLKMSQPVINKILKISNGKATIDYKIKGDEKNGI